MLSLRLRDVTCECTYLSYSDTDELLQCYYCSTVLLPYPPKKSKAYDSRFSASLHVPIPFFIEKSHVRPLKKEDQVVEELVNYLKSTA